MVSCQSELDQECGVIDNLAPKYRSTIKKHIVIYGANAPSILRFRGDLLRELVAKGHKVTAISSAPTQEAGADFAKIGVLYLSVAMKRAEITILGDVVLLFSLTKLLRSIRPDLIINYNAKPMVYGTLGAWLAGCKNRYCVVTGLGYSFSGSTFKQKSIKLIQMLLYHIVFRLSKMVVFQNRDDRDSFCELGLTKKTKTRVVGGSGVNLHRFPVSHVRKKDPVCFLMVSRLLKEKGVVEFFEAAEIVAQKYPGKAKFVHVGGDDVNPGGLTSGELEGKGVVAMAGYHAEVLSFLEECHFFVLPSYREGTPRSTLEALAVGRAVITTDVPGCRDTVREGINGWMIPSKDVTALANAMISALSIGNDEFQKMCLESRRLAERFFDVEIVNEEMINIVGLSGSGNPG